MIIIKMAYICILDQIAMLTRLLAMHCTVPLLSVCLLVRDLVFLQLGNRNLFFFCICIRNNVFIVVVVVVDIYTDIVRLYLLTIHINQHHNSIIFIVQRYLLFRHFTAGIYIPDEELKYNKKNVADIVSAKHNIQTVSLFAGKMLPFVYIEQYVTDMAGSQTQFKRIAVQFTDI